MGGAAEGRVGVAAGRGERDDWRGDDGCCGMSGEVKMAMEKWRAQNELDTGGPIGGGICSFEGRCPPKCPHFRGTFYVFLRCKVIPDIGLSVIKLANVSDVRESTHTYIPTV